MLRFILFGLLISTAADPQSFLSSWSSHDGDYQQGLSDLDARRWRDAVVAFKRSAERNGAEADAALYWKAYAESRSGFTGDALSTLRHLGAQFSRSPWLKQAQALKVEIEARTGQPVDAAAEHDSNLKLLALGTVMQSNPGEALPRIRTILGNGSTEAVKDRALFVLAESDSPDAQKIISDVARSSPDKNLRLHALQYIGLKGGEGAHQELLSLYRSDPDQQNQQAILQQLMIRGYNDDLWRIYQSAPTIDRKRSVLQMMALSGKSDHLLEVARSKDAPIDLRVAAIHSLGMMRDGAPPETMQSFFRTEQSHQLRQAILQSMAMRGDGKTLVAMARAEKDPKQQEEIVQAMSLVSSSKEVTEYMRELLK